MLISLRSRCFAAGIVVALAATLLFAPRLALGQPDPDPGEKLRNTLDQPINFTAVGDWTLKDALDWLTDRYGLAFTIDGKAFEASKIEDVRQCSITAPGEGWNRENVALKDVIRHLLAKVPITNGEATYIILGNRIVVTTAEWATIRWMRQPVNVDCNQATLSSVLRKLARDTGANLVIDLRAAKQADTPVTLRVNNATLETTVTLLAEMADLKALRVGNVLFVTTKGKAKDMRDDPDLVSHVGPCPLPANVKAPALP